MTIRDYKVKLLALVFLISGYGYAEVFASEIKEVTFNEGETIKIQCFEPNRALEIVQATWKYDRLSVKNMFIPTWRNFFFLTGPDIPLAHFGSWDVVNYPILKHCNGRKKCEFIINSKDFESISYKMILTYKYRCTIICHEAHRKRHKRQAGRQSISDLHCVNSIGWTLGQIADHIETMYSTRRNLNNMGSIVSITTQDVTYGQRPPVELVYVVRAHLTSQSRRTGNRRPYPANIAGRMRELNSLQHDDRGHIIADSLDGPVNTLNFFPQYNQLNRVCSRGGTSWWYRFEHEIRNDLQRNANMQIDMTVVLRYEAPRTTGNFRPIGIGLRLERHYPASGNNLAWTDVTEHYFSNEQGWDCEIQPIPDDWFHP